jgi:TRAP-type C4-dicarboxylate transport system substrate-binding protein
MKRGFPTLARTLTLILALTLGAAPAPAATLVKMATLVPDGSIWHQILKEMEVEWGQVTEGRVTLRLYAGGVAGDDPDMVRKMRIGQLQGAALTSGGLTAIDDAFNVLQVPLFFESYEELVHVLEATRPFFAERLEEKGFVLLGWGHGGWVHFFSSQPVRTVEDLRRLKIFTWAGDQAFTNWWKANGFQPVPLAATDILTGLQTGMIQAFPTTPLAALSLQWFRQAPNMLGVPLAPFAGATVVTAATWKKISAADQEKLLQAARRAEDRQEEEIPRQDADAVAEMSKRGLTVNVPDAAARAKWHAEARRFADSMRGGIVPQDVFDLVLRERDAYRGRQGEKGSDR